MIKFVNVKSTAHLASYEFDNVDQVIYEMSLDGYEYKGYFPRKIVGYGVIKEITLVFEKED